MDFSDAASAFVGRQRLIRLNAIRAPSGSSPRTPAEGEDHFDGLEQLSEAVSLSRPRAERAFVLAFLRLGHIALSITWAGEFAGRISRAAQESAVFTEFVNQRLLALRTFIFARRDLSLGVFHFLLRGIEVLLKWAVKLI